jgi:hypothetical protein
MMSAPPFWHINREYRGYFDARTPFWRQSRLGSDQIEQHIASPHAKKLVSTDRIAAPTSPLRFIFYVVFWHRCDRHCDRGLPRLQRVFGSQDLRRLVSCLTSKGSTEILGLCWLLAWQREVRGDQIFRSKRIFRRIESGGPCENSPAENLGTAPQSHSRRKNLPPANDALPHEIRDATSAIFFLV